MAMSDKTPYWMRPNKEIAQEVACMRKVFQQASAVASVYEAFGGIGATAAILRERFPTAIFHAFDLDEKCCELYNRSTKGMALCICRDAAEGLAQTDLSGPEFGAVLDFNRFTVLDLARKEGKWKLDLLQAVMDRKPAWVEVTDSAVCYLGTNYRKYGLAQKSLSDYVSNLGVEFRQRWGYDVKVWANHRAATYMLFTGA